MFYALTHWLLFLKKLLFTVIASIIMLTRISLHNSLVVYIYFLSWFSRKSNTFQGWPALGKLENSIIVLRLKKGCPFSTYAKCSKKLTFITSWYAYVRNGVRNVSFSENFVYVLNGYSEMQLLYLGTLVCIYKQKYSSSYRVLTYLIFGIYLKALSNR